MNVTKWSLLTAVLFSTFSFSFSAMAICNQFGSSGISVFTELPPINKDAPIGSVIGRFSTIGQTTVHGFTCYLPSDALQVTMHGSHTYLGDNIYSSRMPGIVMRVRDSGGLYPYVIQPGVGRSVKDFNGLEVELIKTGPISLLYQIQPGAFHIVANFQTGGTQLALAAAGPIIVRLDTSPTCSVTSPTVNVNMGSVSIADLTATGRSPARNFNIDLSCSGGTAGILEDIFVTLTDQSDPANRSTQLGLTPGSTATGVALEVNNSAGLVSFGPDSDLPGTPGQWFEGSADNGVFSIPLSVNYLQVSPTPTVGSANAVATYTLSYQ